MKEMGNLTYNTIIKQGFETQKNINHMVIKRLEDVTKMIQLLQNQIDYLQKEVDLLYEKEN